MKHAARVLGDRPLGSIRKSDVQAFVAGLDLAPSTVRVVHQHLNALLAAAVEDGLIAKNPAKGVKLPARGQGEVVPPTVKQVAALLDAAPAWFRPAVVLGAGLGLRQAEACGLTVDRIDWLGRAVRTDRQWLSHQGRAELGPVKSASSNRTIPASGWVLAELGQHVGRRHDGFVVHRQGEPVPYHMFGRAWRATTAAAGLDGLRFHDLRHAYASMLISDGCSVRAVCAALGHSAAATTLNLYSHLWPGDEDRLRDAVDRAMAPRSEDRLGTGTRPE